MAQLGDVRDRCRWQIEGALRSGRDRRLASCYATQATASVATGRARSASNKFPRGILLTKHKSSIEVWLSLVERYVRDTMTISLGSPTQNCQNALKTLTFLALPNVENSANFWFDHMFDHLQKNRIFLPFRGVAKVVSRIVRDDEIAGSSPVTSTKKQPKISHFDLFSVVFLYILLKNDSFGLTTCLP